MLGYTWIKRLRIITYRKALLTPWKSIVKATKALEARLVKSLITKRGCKFSWSNHVKITCLLSSTLSLYFSLHINLFILNSVALFILH